MPTQSDAPPLRSKAVAKRVRVLESRVSWAGTAAFRPKVEVTLTLEDYIRGVAGNPIGKVPRTLQDVIDRRVVLDGYAADTTSETCFTPRVVCRLAWLSLRQVQLVSPILPDLRVTEACARYADHLIQFAGRLTQDFAVDAPEHGILRQYFAESVEFWSSLSDLIGEMNVGSLEWVERDVETLLWIRLCVFYACATVTQQGRTRSRREIAEILGRAIAHHGSPTSNSPTSIRLRVAPAIERDFELADRWANFCGTRWKKGARGITVELADVAAQADTSTRQDDDLSNRWSRYFGRAPDANGVSR